MLTETGKIVRLQGNTVWIQTMRYSVCGACQARKGCGQNLLNRLSGASFDLELTLDVSSFDVQEGDCVEICIEEGAVVIASLLAYGVPLLSMLLGIALANSMRITGFGLFLLCTAWLAGGAVLTQVLIKHRFRSTFFEPIMLRRLSRLS